MKYLLAVIAALFVHAAGATSPASAEVNAPAGTIVGTSTSTGRQFLGVPYAQAPVGDLRWTAPRSMPTRSGRLMAQAFGDDCIQPVSWNTDPHPGDKMRGSEDCLFLNIYSSLSDTPKKPVMVWIHGGAFIFGAGRDVDPHVLAEKNDVIAVTLNYRLGALGFLSHPALGEESGNFGILDQQMALRWIQRNIAAFGGDPERVTIFGESAGGVSVCMQLLSPGAKGLFSRAINESGPCKVINRAITDQGGATYANAAGCSSMDTKAIDCLRKIPAEVAAAFSPGPVGLGDTAWQPSYGTSVIPKDARALETGEFNRVPIINGTNRDEGRLFALGAIQQLPDETAYQKNLEIQFGSKASKVLAQYPVRNHDSIALAYAAYMTDWLFACPADRANRAMFKYTPVYAYEFSDRRAPIGLDAPREIGSFGAFHTAEIQYVFQTAVHFFNLPATFAPEQKRLSDQMQKAWVSFARDGSPAMAGEHPWRPVDSSGTPMVRFDTSGPTLVNDFSMHHRCAFWSDL